MLTELMLREVLNAHGVMMQGWGEGAAKTLDHLVQELHAGETRLQIDCEGITRLVTVAYARVTCNHPRYGTLELFEHSQTFTDGRTRQRHYLPGSIAEKVAQGETAREAIERGLREELGLDSTKVEITPQSESVVTSDSPSYPGLRMIARNVYFLVELSEKFYQSAGFQEIQPDKTTTWLWREAGTQSAD